MLVRKGHTERMCIMIDGAKRLHERHYCYHRPLTAGLPTCQPWHFDVAKEKAFLHSNSVEKDAFWNNGD